MTSPGRTPGMCLMTATLRSQWLECLCQQVCSFCETCLKSELNCCSCELQNRDSRLLRNAPAAEHFLDFRLHQDNPSAAPRDVGRFLVRSPDRCCQLNSDHDVSIVSFGYFENQPRAFVNLTACLYLSACLSSHGLNVVHQLLQHCACRCLKA